MARKAKEQEFTARVHIHLKDDPIALKQICELILKAIEIADKKEVDEKQSEAQGAT